MWRSERRHWILTNGYGWLSSRLFRKGQLLRGFGDLKHHKANSVMKTPLLTALLTSFALVRFAQGTVNFVNINAGAGLNAPIFLGDGTTKASGAGFTAELLAGPNAANLMSVATTGFLTGAGAGYFQGGVVTIGSVAPGATAFLQVRVYDTASGSFPWAQANPNGIWGQSSIFSVVTGGAGSPPSTPAALTGLTSFSVGLLIPEPSTLALATLGFSVLFLRRSRR